MPLYHNAGMKRIPAGRIGEPPSLGLSSSLSQAGFKLGRLQTGTPARLDGRTIDFSKLWKQVGDDVPTPFSFLNQEVDNAVSDINTYGRALQCYHPAFGIFIMR